jgi:glycosyltransferase involved in cell wall biosynthesis
MAMLEQVRRRAADFDFLHFHLDYYPFSLFSRQRTPWATTLHGRLDLPEHQPVFDTFSDAPVISISNSQRRPLPQARWVRTIHHGLPERLLMPQSAKPSYFAFLGRIAPEKRLDTAIRIAEHCGVTLKIAAKIDRNDRDYYDETIKPMMNSRFVEYVGEINDHEKSAFLSGAIALLVPIDWPEPFGLVMIEAMACGTPVIAFNRGSVPEVITDGVTGFIVEDEAGAIGASLAHRNSPPLRAALHGEADGARLSRGLSRADGRDGAAVARGVRRGCRACAALGALDLAVRSSPRKRGPSAWPLDARLRGHERIEDQVTSTAGGGSSAGRVSGISSHTAARPHAAIALRPRNATGLPNWSLR